ncbi:MAG: hypothetical protein ACJ71W_00125 [Terriglobales bacterium]
MWTVPVSELCEELGLRPTVFYRWQKELFENGAAAWKPPDCYVTVAASKLREERSG